MSRNIILCSDGTGNKGGQGDDTNVYKLYRSVNLHSNETEQISFYDNGVGTAGNKYLKAISGGIGVGFKANVVDLYEFLIRNYTPGDKIFLFGFSRGASTVRAFAGFLHCCGLLNRLNEDGTLKDEETIQKLIVQAVEAYQKHRESPELAAKFKKQYALNDGQKIVDGNIPIHFIGVWDTVSALGFPHNVTGIFHYPIKALDLLTDKFWKHQYYEYGLNSAVENAYQALAIDEERKTFYPRIWQEHNQSTNIEQVWFAGVHSNVGGGYPRDGLSNVAFDWMIIRARKHGLKFIDGFEDDVCDHANVTSKLYNSRDGLGVFYRYAPRDIENICKDRLQGPIKIHETLVKRLTLGTARYAPGYLPTNFEIVGSEIGGENSHIETDAKTRKEIRTDIDKLVGYRQYLHHTFLYTLLIIMAASIFLAAYPSELLTTYIGKNDAGDLNIISSIIIDIFQIFTPSFFDNFILYIVCVSPFVLVLIAGLSVGMFFLRRYFVEELAKTTEKMRQLLIRSI